MARDHFIERKIEKLRFYYEDLEEILAISPQAMKKDRVRLYACERVFQLIIDEMIDINTYVIKTHNFRTPDDFQSSFITLSENKVIPAAFAARVAPCVGLRNLLVHRYEDIDYSLFLKLL